jgi:hypothetical protein
MCVLGEIWIKNSKGSKWGVCASEANMWQNPGSLYPQYAHTMQIVFSGPTTLDRHLDYHLKCMIW